MLAVVGLVKFIVTKLKLVLTKVFLFRKFAQNKYKD